MEESNKPIMTKYEYTRVKGIRIQQLVDGMEPFVDMDPNEEADYNKIFIKELIQKKIPLMITRPIGYNKTVQIPVSEMNVDKFIL